MCPITSCTRNKGEGLFYESKASEPLASADPHLHPGTAAAILPLILPCPTHKSSGQ